IFFFSSRRRHTRSKRDWSSDVCSSDLDFLSFFPPHAVNNNIPAASIQIAPFFIIDLLMCMEVIKYIIGSLWFLHNYPSFRSEGRSGERRVGKECRSGWGRLLLCERREC